MTNHEKYQQAMHKIAPSEEWKADTLAKMAELRAQQQSGAPQQTPQLKVSRKAMIPFMAAALFALVMVPTVLQQTGGGLTAGNAAVEQTADSTPAMYALPEEPEEKMQIVGSTREGAAEDTAPMPEDAPEQALDRTAATPLPMLTYGEPAGGMGGEVYYAARSLDELENGNPTRGLPQAELPAELPVWYAPCGEANSAVLYDRLERAAAHLNLPLYTDPQEPLPQGDSDPDHWPCQVRGVLTAAPDYDPAKRRNEQWDKIDWEVSAEASVLTLVSGKSNSIGSDESQYTSKAPNKKADRLALEQFGALAGISNPVYFITPSYSGNGTLRYEWFNHFYYEGGTPEDDITQRLLNYSFVRVSGSLLADGALGRARVSAMPETPLAGWYPLRTMEEAAATTLARRLEADRQNQLIPQDLTIQSIVDWQLEYVSSGADPWIQPVYCFTLRTSLTPEEAFYELPDSEGYQVYVQYRVSALPEEYCASYTETFN